MDITTLSVTVVVFFFFIVAIFNGIVTVEQQEVAIVQRFGKFSQSFGAGIHWKAPFIESVAARLSLKLQLLPVQVETKTKDNVFVTVTSVVQYQIPEADASTAFYKLQDPKQQIQAYVFDNLRAQIPTMDLDDVFSNKDTIANNVDAKLTTTMSAYGYSIVKVLITEIDPAQSVKDAMNEIQTQTRLAQAASQQGEAAKILVVKAAEAEKETKRLSGEGIAAERKAIVDGLKQSVEELAAATATTSYEAMGILMQTQYYDTMKAVGTGQGTHTIMVPFGADGAEKVRDAITTGMLVAK